MIFRRFYDDNLAQASYMIACEKTRDAIVVDPNMDSAQYLRAAGADRVRIAHVTETHIHADFVSGARALAEASGATLHLSAEGDAKWGYAADLLESVDKLRDGSAIELGKIRITALHTPGHTPEHLAFLITDLGRGEEAVGILTGDFVFVGDVGRPDLLERAAGAVGNMEESAARLFESIQALKRRDDYLQLWPGHGAGSACGKSLGLMPQSTLGYEKLFNWAFAETDIRAFTEHVLEDQPVPPRYFAEMKRVNRIGSVPLDRAAPKRLEPASLDDALARTVVLDTRTAEKFAAGHIPGTLNIPYNKSFLNWCGALLPYDRDISLITDADDDEAVRRLILDLAKIGLVRIAGFFGAEVVRKSGAPKPSLEIVPQVTVRELRDADSRARPQVIDVRAPDEWRQGHLPGAIHIPLASLPERLSEIDRSRPVVLHCKGGGRSSIATSFLQSQGVKNASNLRGGYDQWVADGFEIESDGQKKR